jgi:uncharacterized protein (DUF608 family)
MDSDTRTYPEKATQAAFLLGGIGTGNVSLGSRGELRDWELFNNPAKGRKLPYSFFALSCRGLDPDGPEPASRILEAPAQPPFTDPLGLHTGTVAGLPHFESSRLRGEYPFVSLELSDASLPLAVSLEAFTPFIPLDADDSGLPCAVFRYTVKNESERPLRISVAGSLPNMVGFTHFDAFGNMHVKDGAKNEYREGEGFRGIYYSSAGVEPAALDFGNVALITTEAAPSHKAAWLEGGWCDGIQDFWDEFSAGAGLSPTSDFRAQGGRLKSDQKRPLVGSLGVTKDLAPGAAAVFAFALAWYFPNRPRSWHPERGSEYVGNPPTFRNFYATRFADAWAVGGYLVRNLERLEGLSRSFRGALFGSTLPAAVIDALAANITALRSPTCFRLEDGTFVSWEGCFDAAGSCEGSCTHVWNYAQTLGFLFPELESTMLRVAFRLETGADGEMAFRTRRIFGLPRWELVPAADGQLGAIIRLYRDWKLRGDEAFLREVWPKAVACLDYATRTWDTDDDGLLDGEQHNTYDIEFHGPTSFTNLIYFAALKAAAEMAGRLGDEELRRKYEAAYRAGAERLDGRLWNGDYYVQDLADVNRYRYQYGAGCLTDQLFGQSLARTVGLGALIPRERERRALLSIVEHNFKPAAGAHANAQRSFAVGAEPGLVLCTWPKGGRPRLPFVYSDEVWTGVEYQVAAHLFHEGLIGQGLALVEAVRSRYNGYNRNPWDEIECGHHYVRSMASWGLLIALSGYEFDIPGRRIAFAPKLGADDFRCFFSTGRAWGVYSQRLDPATGRTAWKTEVLYGSLDGIAVNGENEKCK